MKIITSFLIILLSVLSVYASPLPQEKSSAITQQELQTHIKYLTSDELEGRGSGTPGNVLAAKYIENEFKSYGLEPKGTDGFQQPFDFISTVKIGEGNSLSVKVKGSPIDLKLDDGFRPLGFTVDTSITAPLAFVGYGISADSLKYDDYAGIDITGKIAVMMRYSPLGNKDTLFTKYTALRMKAMTARNKGAVAVIIIQGPIDDPESRLIKFSFDRGMGSSGIAALTMTWNAFDSIMHLNGKDFKTIQETINKNQQPQSFDLPEVTATFQTQTDRVNAKTLNVVGYLEGSDSDLKNQVVAIGAHFDHLGMGGEGSLKPDTVAIHHGADDNGSGTAGLLELAQYCAAHKSEYKRSILFISFSGEELGTLGSMYYVNNPTIPLDNIVTMFNMDMIGRMKDSLLDVEGMGTSPGFEKLVKDESTDPSMKITLKPDGYGPSDHAEFYGKGIPVMFFFTGNHKDYHTPSDTWDKINYEGEQKVVTLVASLTKDIANLAEKPAFTKAASSAMGGGDRPGSRVSMGIVPDYASDVVGLKISGTRKDGPAEKAGIKEGDVLIKFGKKDIKNIYDYMYVLGEYKSGDQVNIIVKRGTEELTLPVTLSERK